MASCRLCVTEYTRHAAPIVKKATEARYAVGKLEGVKEDVADLLSNYAKEARGPAKLRVLAQSLPTTLKTIADCAYASSRIVVSNIEKEYAAQKTLLEESIQESQKSLDELDNKKREHALKVHILCPRF